jgi:quercetin dioxygenase-like cupin family protein
VIGMRIAAGLLAIATLAGTTACAADPSAAAPTPAQAQAPTATSAAPSETLTPLLQQALPDVADKTFTSAIVEFPPGARATPHRHGSALVYAYVLEGTVRSQLDDKPVTTYRQGENWIEQPGAHHVLTENTSPTDPAKLLVVFVANTGDELKVDDPHS